ncbi:PREDICTED: cell wall protein DAN4-like [Branchiostoma belcheri]|uniref:Apolipoprotein D n=1 Tax=Branchiostoma belcheri TaxID=7741 RepID=A0A6P4YB93_BRABE|nr:PREDICTED: cell wall protein DAN4-like [Branchiostoma belcheri]
MAGLRFLLLALSAVVVVVDGQRFGKFSEGKCPDLPVKANFSLESYMGRWYEIARFPVAFERSLKCSEAWYYLHRHGGIKVFTKGIDSHGRVSKAVYRAHVPDPEVPAKLSVGFSRFWPKGPYWVLDTDYSGYAVVWSCINIVWGLFKVEMAWILGRERTLDEDVMKDIVYEVTEMGIDAALFRMTDQTDCPGPPTTTVVPLSNITTPLPSNSTTNVTTPPPTNTTTPVPSNTTTKTTKAPPTNTTTPVPSNTTTKAPPTNTTTPVPSNTTTKAPPTNTTTPVPSNTTTKAPPTNTTTPLPSNTTTTVTPLPPTNTTTPLPIQPTTVPSNTTTNVTEIPPSNVTTPFPANITTNITEMPPDFNTTTPPNTTTAKNAHPCRRKKNKKRKNCSPSSRKIKNKFRKNKRPYHE